MKRFVIITIATVCLAACGDDATNNTTANNTAANNTAANNTAANNTAANNTAANNTAANNTAANNTAANNTAANNQVANAANAPACNPGFAEADACGGSPVGSWAIAEACAEPIEVPGCADATVTVEANNVSGSLIVTDSNWAYNASGTVVFNASIPASCVALVGDCAGVAALFDADCADAAAGACDCIVEDEQQISNAGSYTLQGGNRAVVDDGSEWLFCIEGDGVTLKEDTGNAPVFTGGR